MAKNLVIVESPAKAKKISTFLGKDYQVESCFGHIADLPSSELGVDVDGDFHPKYIVSDDKKDIVRKLKKLAKKAETVWLASDEDREGEAIAWHLQEQLNLTDKNTKRITFNSITKAAILDSLDNPISINYNLVNAQQARRVLDRLVGYELSPVLWRKVKGGLSAGRVQSVAVRLIVERELEIQAFKPKASFRVDAEFTNTAGKKFKAKLPKNFATEKEAEAFLKSCAKADFTIDDLKHKPAKKSPTAPFTTSTLQQEASRKLYFPVAKTMMVAQRLYEAGLITYMRTDSVNLSKEAKSGAKTAITKLYGAKYSNPKDFKTKTKGAQEAHEAIRPTDFSVQSVEIDNDQSRLYSLIWKRAIASQMSNAELERTNVKIKNSVNKEILTSNGEVIKFDGFLKVYLEGSDEEVEQTGMLPRMAIGESLAYNYIQATERYSRSKGRFTEASLVKRMEELNIGRPSTYAPTISTIQRRKYVDKSALEGAERKYMQLTLSNAKVVAETLSETTGVSKGKLIPTDIGMIVTDFLVHNFKDILDFGFTAKVEEDFDEIANGNVNWIEMIKGFYKKFHLVVEDVKENAERESGERILGTDPKSGKPILVRLGRFGAMAQIGDRDDEEKVFASLKTTQQLNTITLQEALDLFLLPKNLGNYEGKEVIVANGRFGPYVKFDDKYVSIPREDDPLSVSLEDAIVLIEAKREADAPIAEFDGLPVQKGVGRFGPFIKWNNMFINVNKKYDFDNLTQENIDELIQLKKQKEIDKIIHNWEEEGIRLEKARWKRFNLIKGKTKIELPKTTKAEKMTLVQAQAILEKNSKKKPKRKTRKTAVKKKK